MALPGGREHPADGQHGHGAHHHSADEILAQIHQGEARIPHKQQPEETQQGLHQGYGQQRDVRTEPIDGQQMQRVVPADPASDSNQIDRAEEDCSNSRRQEREPAQSSLPLRHIGALLLHEIFLCHVRSV